MKPVVSIGAYNPEDSREIKRRVLGTGRSIDATEHKGVNKLGWHYVIMREDLAPATDPLTGFTTAKARIVMYKDGLDSLELEEVTEEELEIDITNRSTTVGLAEGDFAVVKWFIKEWMPLLPGSSNQFMYGVVREVLCDGYYNVEIATWNGTTPNDASSSAACDICSHVTPVADSSGITDCTAEIDLPTFNEANSGPPIVQRQVTRTGTIVLAFDFQSRFVPLKLWSDCLLTNTGAKNPIEDTPSLTSSGDEEDVYMVVRGHQEHLLQYRERWECCNGVDTLMGRTPIIFPGKECAEEVCTTCE